MIAECRHGVVKDMLNITLYMKTTVKVEVN
jgi:hypothetical protein